MTERPDETESREDSAEQDEVKLSWRRGAKRRILQGTAVLPSFVTVLNGLAGLSAIHYATKEAFGAIGPEVVDNLRMAVSMLVLAMIFDMLDGRLARMTRRTSDFGGQLDSLCDAVSFGVAPAILMTRTVVLAMRQLPLNSHLQLERIVWSIGALYLACAVMRLARFNVENEPDESAHMDFRGLPTPGAAGVVVSLVLLFTRVTNPPFLASPWQDTIWLLVSVSIILPVMTLAAALLMVSNIQYSHLVNHWVRGRKPVSYILKLVVVVLAMVYEFALTAALFASVYALSGPVTAAWGHFRPHDDRDDDDESDDHHGDAAAEGETEP